MKARCKKGRFILLGQPEARGMDAFFQLAAIVRVSDGRYSPETSGQHSLKYDPESCPARHSQSLGSGREPRGVGLKLRKKEEPWLRQTSGDKHPILISTAIFFPYRIPPPTNVITNIRIGQFTLRKDMNEANGTANSMILMNTLQTCHLFSTESFRFLTRSPTRCQQTGARLKDLSNTSKSYPSYISDISGRL